MENGDVINDAVYRRNNKVEDLFDVKLKFDVRDGAVADYATWISTLNSSILAGDDAYQLAGGYGIRLTSDSLNGNYQNLKNNPYIDFTNPWWPSNIIEASDIGGNMFACIGNIEPLYYDMTYAIYFNKKIADEFKIGDIYKIVTDSVTMRLQVNNANRKIFMIDIPDFRPFNYTGARTDLDLIDKSTRVYDSNSKRFTQKWWSTIPNHTIFPYNQWCYEFYESGKYSEAAKPIFDELRTSQQSDPKNQLIGTWKNTMEIQMIAGDGVENWVENMKKVDNWKEMLAYLNQTNPKREYDQNDFAEYYIFTPSKHFFFAMFYKRQLVAGEYDNITYNGKETFVSGDNQNRRIYWLTKDAFVMNSNPVGKEKWCIYERVTDKNTMLSRICSHFIQHKE